MRQGEHQEEGGERRERGVPEARTREKPHRAPEGGLQQQRQNGRQEGEDRERLPQGRRVERQQTQRHKQIHPQHERAHREGAQVQAQHNVPLAHGRRQQQFQPPARPFVRDEPHRQERRQERQEGNRRRRPQRLDGRGAAVAAQEREREEAARERQEARRAERRRRRGPQSPERPQEHDPDRARHAAPPVEGAGGVNPRIVRTPAAVFAPTTRPSRST